MAFNANGTMKQHYEFSKQLQDLHVCVALISDTSETSLEVFLFQITSFIQQTATGAEKAELPLLLEESFPISM
jgi:hypothetical protein